MSDYLKDKIKECTELLRDEYDNGYAKGFDEALVMIRAKILNEMSSYSGTGEEVIQAYADGLKKGLDIIDKCKAEKR